MNTNVLQPPPHLSTIKQLSTTDPAPVQLLLLNGSCHTDVLPDSRADILAADKQLLHLLNDHVHNLLPSIISYCKWAEKYPLGYLLVTFTIGYIQYTENVHIYPNTPGTILLWKAAKVLTEHYPQSIPLPTISKHPPWLNAHIMLPSLYHKLI